MRRARADMVTQIEAFQREAYARVVPYLGRTPIPMEWDYRDIMRDCDVWYLADDDGMTGVLILRMRDDDLFLESVATADRVAGQGLAGQMMEFAFVQARDAGKPCVRLITNAQNPAAAWYEAAGFSVEKREQRPGRVILHFAKPV